MPIYDYSCEKCHEVKEVYQKLSTSAPPVCCGQDMERKYSLGNLVIDMGYPGWVGKIDEIHKAQEQRGERLRFVHPSEIGAN